MRLPILAVALSVAVPALAHHGFTGRYDTTTPLYLSGEVSSVVWGYPHAVIEVSVVPVADVPQALVEEFGAGLSVFEGAERVSVELPPVALFNALEDRIATGDAIALVVLRNCDPPNQLRAQWVAPSQGEPVLRTSSLQGEVAGC